MVCPSAGVAGLPVCATVQPTATKTKNAALNNVQIVRMVIYSFQFFARPSYRRSRDWRRCSCSDSATSSALLVFLPINSLFSPAKIVFLVTVRFSQPRETASH